MLILKSPKISVPVSTSSRNIPLKLANHSSFSLAVHSIQISVLRKRAVYSVSGSQKGVDSPFANDSSRPQAQHLASFLGSVG